LQLGFSILIYAGKVSVVDLHHFDVDPDSTYHLDADLDVNPDSDFLFEADRDADPDQTFCPDADPDPDPCFKKRLKPLKSANIGSCSIHFVLISAN
jgi:hypothetical protein